MIAMLKTAGIALTVLLAIPVHADQAPTLTLLVETDAHEGPVVVAEQNRLYFTTKPDFAAEDTHIAIKYVDLGTKSVGTFKARSNMANGMWLTGDGKALFVAEQGTPTTPSAVSRISLADGARTVIIDSFEGKPFNSINKVIEGEDGWIYFSDPDYGFHQGFKPKPALPMAVYAHNPGTGRTVVLTDDAARPHGLALSPDRKTLYIGDTDAIDGSNPYDATRSHSVAAGALLAPDNLGPVQTLLDIPVGIPDGFITLPLSGDLLVAAGDGLRHYTADGTFIALYAIPGGAVNVTAHGNTYFATADTVIWQLTLPQN